MTAEMTEALKRLGHRTAVLMETVRIAFDALDGYAKKDGDEGSYQIQIESADLVAFVYYYENGAAKVTMFLPESDASQLEGDVLMQCRRARSAAKHAAR